MKMSQQSSRISLFEHQGCRYLFDIETILGTDRVFDRLHVSDGQLKAIHSFYYRRDFANNDAAN